MLTLGIAHYKSYKYLLEGGKSYNNNLEGLMITFRVL